jgi:predicted amidophosphoribosyltransferase
MFKKANCYEHKEAESIYAAGYRKQKEGEWEKRTFIIFDSEKVGYNCSECNTTWDTETKFCPNCGAHMSGGKE